MRNRNTLYAHQQAKIYRAYYKPSFNLLRFFKSIFSVLLFGSATVAQNYAPVPKFKKRLR